MKGMKVVVAKLAGGMMVIGEQLEPKCAIFNAMEVGVVPVAPGQMRVVIQPLMAPFCDDTKGYTIEGHHIIGQTKDVKKDMEDSYRQAQTGIIMPGTPAAP